MKVLAIGDPHGDLGKIRKVMKRVEKVDILLLTGDLGKADLMRKMAFTNIERRKKGLEEKEFSSKEKKKAFMEAYDSSLAVVRFLSRVAPVYTIFGNVESRNSETREMAKEIGLKLPFLTDALNKIKGVRVINNRAVKVKGVRIGGLDYFIDDVWVRTFKPDDYNDRLQSARKQTVRARKILKKFGNVDILICHQPPYGVLDKVTFKQAPKHWRGKRAGSKVILDFVRKGKAKYVFCGHIHEGEGKKKIGKTEVYNLGVVGHKVVEF
ncbi:hypothetical protein CMI45_00860 [Candidatus Pacearchaeota archaeon]|jgi:Icc-related predicted phosphoesterase|nr:hypothetical protein [Candidatus Pacearchaeota archaeon]|tara:strand:+ start:6610 stop:7410 length:801 start_codon:yes stop_codon:yes gene_type:complete